MELSSFHFITFSFYQLSDILRFTTIVTDPLVMKSLNKNKMYGTIKGAPNRKSIEIKVQSI